MCAKKATSPAAKPPVGKKSVASSGRKSVSGDTNGRSASKVSATPSSAATASASSKNSIVSAAVLKASDRSLSNHDIGIVAGEIWGYLKAKDAQTVAAIKKAVTAPADVVAAAIGWLAREDKLEFSTSGKTVKLSLK